MGRVGGSTAFLIVMWIPGKRQRIHRAMYVEGFQEMSDRKKVPQLPMVIELASREGEWTDWAKGMCQHRPAIQLAWYHCLHMNIFIHPLLPTFYAHLSQRIDTTVQNCSHCTENSWVLCTHNSTMIVSVPPVAGHSLTVIAKFCKLLYIFVCFLY